MKAVTPYLFVALFLLSSSFTATATVAVCDILKLPKSSPKTFPGTIAGVLKASLTAGQVVGGNCLKCNDTAAVATATVYWWQGIVSLNIHIRLWQLLVHTTPNQVSVNNAVAGKKGPVVMPLASSWSEDKKGWRLFKGPAVATSMWIHNATFVQAYQSNSTIDGLTRTMVAFPLRYYVTVSADSLEMARGQFKRGRIFKC